MGIRLGASLVLGVYDLQFKQTDDDGYEIIDSRLSNKNWDEVMVQPLNVKQAKKFYREDPLTLLSAVDNLMIRNGENERKPRQANALIYHNEQNPCVFGIRLESLRDHEIFYAMASFSLEFRQPGYKLIPSIPLDDDQSHMGSIIRMKGVSPEVIKNYRKHGIESKLTLLKNGWNYPYFDTRIEFWALGAEYILRQVGFNVLASDLKLMLCWDWN